MQIQFTHAQIINVEILLVFINGEVIVFVFSFKICRTVNFDFSR